MDDLGLPPAVCELALRLGANPGLTRSMVQLTQVGRLRKGDASSWISFTATQTVATRECAFDWRARAGPLRMISARDALKDSEGRFDVVALGIIPISRAAHSVALTPGQLMRYLAELAWAPDAIMLNPHLRWQAVNRDTLVVGAGSGATAVEVTLTLDGQGRIAGAFAPDRPRSAAPPLLLTPWRGRFTDYRHHQGYWLPFAGEVGWVVDGEETVYWQGRVERWETSSSGP